MVKSLICASPTTYVYIDDAVIYMVFRNTKIIYDINRDDVYVIEKHDDAITIKHINDDLRKTLVLSSIKTKLDVIDFTCIETEGVMVTIYKMLKRVIDAINEIEYLSDLGI